MASGSSFEKNIYNGLRVYASLFKTIKQAFAYTLSPMQRGVPIKVQKLLDKVNEISFERDNIEYPILCPTVNGKR
jgi:hypothetical protein